MFMLFEWKKLKLFKKQHFVEYKTLCSMSSKFSINFLVASIYKINYWGCVSFYVCLYMGM